MTHDIRLSLPPLQSSTIERLDRCILSAVRGTDVLHPVRRWRDYLLLYRMHIPEKI
jgi:hypothetical protein